MLATLLAPACSSSVSLTPSLQGMIEQQGRVNINSGNPTTTTTRRNGGRSTP